MVRILWLKRDLRLHDHSALDAALEAGSVLGVFVFEPSIWRAPDADRRHFEFLRASLEELRAAWLERGGRLLVRVGECPDVFDRLFDEFEASGVPAPEALVSHEETGNGLTFDRDRRVGRWCRARDLPWIEIPQNGVVRRLGNRDGWSRHWNRRMGATPLPSPGRLPVPSGGERLELGSMPEADSLGVAGAPIAGQSGGERAGRESLESFLDHRGVDYRRAMSSPATAFEACSRIGPHLAWGTLSLRLARWEAEGRLTELRGLAVSGATDARRHAKSVESFLSRLRWHCHFMQKLESEPAIEFRNMNRAFDGMREDFFETDEAKRRFEAWREGRTGYPMVDACMRCLHATGWINFRMRAMLASFSSHHLWLHWREPSVWLARQFVDYEPGIHYSQFQMQSGTTGINTVRIYSPAKQARDHDPTGVFIRRWIPELEHVPDEFLADPSAMPPLTALMAGCEIGTDYPSPIVDHSTALRDAKDRLFAIRKSAAGRREARRVYVAHGSRKGNRHRAAEDRNGAAGV